MCRRSFHAAIAALVLGSGALLSPSASVATSDSRISIGFVRGASVFLISPDTRRVTPVLRGKDTGDTYRHVYYEDPAWSATAGSSP